MREKLYQSIERKDQDDILLNYIKIDVPKNLSVAEKSRIFSGRYYVPKTTGGLVKVCKTTLAAAAGIVGKRRMEVILQKAYKKMLLTGEISEPSLESMDDKELEKYEKRKEKFLKLKSGSYQQFVSVFGGSKKDEELRDEKNKKIQIRTIE